MKKLSLILVLLTLSFSSFAEDEFMNFGNKNFSETKALASKWVFKVGIDYTAYKTTLPEYKGRHDSIRNGELEEVLGLGLSYGREFYIGKGFSASLSLGISYAKSLQREIGGADELDIEVASTRKSHLISSGEIQGSINYMIDYSLVDIQPFLEISAGIGKTELDYEYNREPLEEATIPNSSENYDVSSEEIYNLAKASIGMNIISFNGLVTYFKVTTVKLFIHERNIKGSSNLFATPIVVNYNDKDDKVKDEISITMASIGLGYMF